MVEHSELGIRITSEDIEHYLSNMGIMLVNKTHSFIEAGTKESLDIVVYYKGKKVTNVVAIELSSSTMEFGEKKDEVLNWRKEIEG